MPSDVEVRNFEPKIKVNVILLASLVGSVILAPGPSHDQELIVEAAHRVSVSGVLQLVHCDAVKGGRPVVDDLVALLQRGRVLVDFASANQEQLIAGGLDVHEVVLEGKGDVD